MYPSRSLIFKTKVVNWLGIGTLVAQIWLATGSAPPGTGPWPMHCRLLSIAYNCVTFSCAIHILRHVDSWTAAQLDDWAVVALAVGSVNNLVSFFFLPTFDVTRATWPYLAMYHMFHCNFIQELPPMHVLVELSACLSVFMFLDFQKACSLARSSQQQLLGSSSYNAQLPRYILHHGLPLLLLGLAAAVMTCTWSALSRSRAEARKVLPPKSANSNSQGEKAPGSAQTGDPDSAPPAAVPLETLGIHVFTSLGLCPALLLYHSCIIRVASCTQSCIVRLASWAQRIVWGAVCLPVCFCYMLRTFPSRFESKPFHISAEELVLVIVCSFVVGRDSSKLDMLCILERIQARLLASQALLTDVLPAHLVNRMLNMQETEQQRKQRQQRQRAKAGTTDPAGAPGAASSSWVSSSGSLVWRSVQLARASSLWRRSSARAPAGPEDRPRDGVEVEDVGYTEPQESWAQGQGQPGGAAPGVPSAFAKPAPSRQSSLGSCVVCEDLGHAPSWEGADGGGAGAAAAWEAGGSCSPMHPAAAAALLPASGPANPAAAHPARARSLSRAFSQTLLSARPSLWALPNQLALGLSSLAAGAAESASASPVQSISLPEQPVFLSGRTTAANHECVTMFFSDLCGFSSWSSKLHPEKVMSTLNDLYTRLDDLILNEYPGLYKVETVGDAYIVAANLLTPDPNHAATAVRFAMRARQEAHKVTRPDRDNGDTLEMRIGLHSGSIMSGIVGKIRRRFCLFGDTMNMASRTESSCPEGGIQLTAATYTLAEPCLRGDLEVRLRERGEVVVKGSEKPLMMYLASAPEHLVGPGPQQGEPDTAR